MATVQGYAPKHAVFPARFLARARSIGKSIMNGIASMSTANACMQEAEYLQSLSDEALEERGLERDQIVQYTFKRYFDI